MKRFQDLIHNRCQNSYIVNEQQFHRVNEKDCNRSELLLTEDLKQFEMIFGLQDQRIPENYFANNKAILQG